MSKILIKGIISEDFVNYKKPCMTIMFPRCSFKCGKDLCQNSELALSDNLEIDIEYLVNNYISNPITSAICFQGLEPFDSPEVFELIRTFRDDTVDDIVIFTGYTRQEVTDKGWLDELKRFTNIIVKYGRYYEDKESRYDEVLGVTLSSNNQYAVKES